MTRTGQYITEGEKSFSLLFVRSDLFVKQKTKNYSEPDLEILENTD